MTGTRGGEDADYLMTGATGFLGSHIMAGLLRRGKRLVIAGRASGNRSLQERIRTLLAWFGIEHLQGAIEYHETDFMAPRMGLDEENYETVCDRGLSIIHCASDTSFMEKDRAKVMASNVESLTGILTFACKSKTRCFHLISSAYAAGTDHTECAEGPVTSTRFTNVYEESKARAEAIVSGRCREAGLPFTIIRPSIIYGDSATGRSLKFNALYYPVRSLLLIRDIYLEDIKNDHGARSTEYGIHIGEHGTLHLPLRIRLPHEGRINLVPVDHFTETVLSIVQSPTPGAVYHITARNAVSMRQLASYTERFLHISGIEVVGGAPPPDQDEARNPPEEFFDHFIKAYRPYMSDQRVFRREHTDSLTASTLPPDLSYEIFQRCMSFAVSVDWGKKLFG